MDGISASEAVSYGLQHMFTMGAMYLLGLASIGFGVLLIQNSIGAAAALILIGVAVILGGLHGAIYKMAGDATARVISRSEATGQLHPESSSTDGSEEEEPEADTESHPDPGIGN